MHQKHVRQPHEKRSLERVTKPVKAAEPITLEDKETLWGMHVLGEESPDQLRDTVLFLIGLTFALRGGKSIVHCKRLVSIR